METDDYVFFFGHTPNKSGIHIFSQWYPINFVENLGDGEIHYVNTEQYMMAHKAMLFDDDEYFEKIMSEMDPSKIKALGRKIRNFDPNIWDECKFDIVVNGNRLKFGQNPDLLKRLLKSGDKTIVEASPYDKVWGIGLRATQAIKIPENKWPGENLLGKALMIVRDEFK